MSEFQIVEVGIPASDTGYAIAKANLKVEVEAAMVAGWLLIGNMTRSGNLLTVTMYKV